MCNVCQYAVHGCESTTDDGDKRIMFHSTQMCNACKHSLYMLGGQSALADFGFKLGDLSPSLR